MAGMRVSIKQIKINRPVRLSCKGPNHERNVASVSFCDMGFKAILPKRDLIQIKLTRSDE